MKRLALCFLVLAATAIPVITAQAATINWVKVGDAGNVADTQVMTNDGTTGYGSVGTTYRIGKFEVSNSEYREFLSAVAATDTFGLYNEEMTTDANGGITRSGSPGSFTYAVKPGRDNNPVNFVSFYDSARFANWLHNGQPSGAQDSSTTEDGAYTFSGATTVSGRNASALVFLPSENEWYKAAYYKGGGTNEGYWDYATQSDATPTSEPPPGGTNSANFFSSVTGFAVTGSTVFDGGQNYLTNVGTYSDSESAYGTFDQTANVWEWNEVIGNGTNRGLRGGSWRFGHEPLPAFWRDQNQPILEDHHTGFRVAAFVPEPSSITLATLALVACGRRRRRA